MPGRRCLRCCCRMSLLSWLFDHRPQGLRSPISAAQPAATPLNFLERHFAGRVVAHEIATHGARGIRSRTGQPRDAGAVAIHALRRAAAGGSRQRERFVTRTIARLCLTRHLTRMRPALAVLATVGATAPSSACSARSGGVPRAGGDRHERRRHASIASLARWARGCWIMTAWVSRSRFPQWWLCQLAHARQPRAALRLGRLAYEKIHLRRVMASRWRSP